LRKTNIVEKSELDWEIVPQCYVGPYDKG
jgi:hypothetical protein